jgi:hypothetical protein
MPFKSKKQWRWAFAQGKSWARRWTKKSSYRRLPRKAKSPKAGH